MDISDLVTSVARPRLSAVVTHVAPMRRSQVVRLGGGLLLGISLLSLIQSAREFHLWRGTRYVDEWVTGPRSFPFGGHTVAVSDDQPTDTLHSQQEWPGTLWISVDGQPVGVPSRAGIRRSVGDLGRYHAWFAAWEFLDRRTGERSIWLARRLQPPGAWSPRFEVSVMDARGGLRTTRYRAYQLSTSFPLYRSTQFLRWNESAFPLSTLEWVAFPLLLVVFPFGTLLLGTYLLGRR